MCFRKRKWEIKRGRKKNGVVKVDANGEMASKRQRTAYRKFCNDCIRIQWLFLARVRVKRKQAIFQIPMIVPSDKILSNTEYILLELSLVSQR